MILDTSALLAILLEEAEAEVFVTIVQAAETVRFSAAGYLEAAITIERRADEIRKAMFDDALHLLNIQIEPVTFDQALLARQAFRMFGKGRHPASLNFGDCFTYALAKTMREPVLFKGGNFSQTDLIPAWMPDRAP